MHLLDKVSGTEEESLQAFFHFLIVDRIIFIKDECLEVFLGFVVFSQFQDQVVFRKEDIQFFSEGPDLEG